MAVKIIKKRGRPFGTKSKALEKKIKKPISGVETADNAAGKLSENLGKDSKGKFVAGHAYRIGVVQNKFRKLLIEASGDEEFKDVVYALITKCKQGDVNAISIYLNKLMPNAPTVEGLHGLKTTTAKEISDSMSKVIEAASEAELSHEGAYNMMKLLESKRDFLRVEELEKTLLAHDALLTKAGIKK